MHFLLGEFKFLSEIKAMKIIIKSMAFAAVVYSGVGASGAASAQGLLENCSTDIVKFCSQVSPGNGRVVSCLYAHEDSITEACDAATDDMGALIDGFFASVGEAYAICAPDIESKCSDVKFGQGRIVSCLAENQETLGQDCADIVTTLKEDLAD